MKRAFLIVLISATLISIPHAAKAEEQLPDAVISCVASTLGADVAASLGSQQPTPEQEQVIAACFQQLGLGGPGGPGDPGGGQMGTGTPSGKCVSAKGVRRLVPSGQSPNRLGVNIGQYPYNPSAFYYSPATLAQDGYGALRYTMQLYYDGATGKLLHGKGDGPLSLNLKQWLCSHSDEIREAKQAGLAVALFVELLDWDSVQTSQKNGAVPNFDHPDSVEKRLAKEYLAAMPAIAKFAEKYKVDWYDPANEADKGFTAANAARIVKAAPKRSKAYKGLLVSQPLVTPYLEAGIVPDLSDYDAVSLHDGDILRAAQEYESTGNTAGLFQQSVTAWQWAQDAGVPRYIVGEIGQFDAVSPLPSVEATSAIMDAYLDQFPNPQVLLCQDNPSSSMDRFETSPMNPVCRALQKRFPGR